MSIKRSPNFKDIKMFNKEKKQVVFVTGCTGGIGAGICEEIKKKNYFVVGLSRKKPSETQMKSIDNWEYQNVLELNEFEAVCARYAKAFGSIHGLVNAAGISIPQGQLHSEEERFQKTLETNLISVFNLILILRPFLTCGSSIVNITSINSFQAFPANPGYVASKFGLRGLTKALARDFGECGIRVNAVAPGYVQTKMTETTYNDDVAFRDRSSRSMLDRWGDASEIGAAVSFLLSADSEFITGTDLVVDGGWTAKGM